MKSLAFILLTLFSTVSMAEIAVIVHPSNASNLDDSSITRIFLGKAKSFPDGSQAIAVNQSEGSAATNYFNENLVGKSASQLKAYWSKLVFTGKGTPPQEVASDAEVIELVSKNPSLIGYVDAASVDGSVKAIITF